MSAESISTEIVDTLHHEIMVSKDRTLAEKLQVLKSFVMDNKNKVYIGKKENEIEMAFSLGKKVAFCKSGNALEECNLYMDIFQKLVLTYSDAFVREKRLRVKIFLAIADILEFRLIRKTPSIDFMKVLLDSATTLLKSNSELFDFCSSMLKFLVFTRSHKNFKAETLEFVFGTVQNCISTDGEERSYVDEFESSDLSLRLLTWGKNFHVDIRNILVGREENLENWDTKGAETWRRQMTATCNAIFFKEVVSAITLVKQPKAEDEKIDATDMETALLVSLSQLVNRVTEDAFVLSHCYGSWLWELSLISEELVDPSAVVDSMVERIISQQHMESEVKCAVLHNLLSALYTSHMANRWSDSFEPASRLRKSFRRIIAEMGIHSKFEEDANAEAKLDLMTLVMLLDGHAMSKAMIQTTSCALLMKHSNFILISLRYYDSIYQINKYFKSFFISSLQQIGFDAFQDEMFILIEQYWSDKVTSVNMETTFNLVNILFDAFVNANMETKPKVLKVVLKLSNLSFGHIREENLTIVDAYEENLTEVIQKIELLNGIDIEDNKILEKFVTLFTIVTSQSKNTVVKNCGNHLTEMIALSSECKEGLGNSVLFAKYEQYCRMSSKKERKTMLELLAEQLLNEIDELSCNEAECFMKHPRVFSDPSVHNAVIRKLKEESRTSLTKTRHVILESVNTVGLTDENLTKVLEIESLPLKVLGAILHDAFVKANESAVDLVFLTRVVLKHTEVDEDSFLKSFEKVLEATMKFDDLHLSAKIDELLAMFIQEIKSEDNSESVRLRAEIGVAMVLLKMELKKKNLEKDTWLSKKSLKFLTKRENVIHESSHFLASEHLLGVVCDLILKNDLPNDDGFEKICGEITKSSTKVCLIHIQLITVFFKKKFSLKGKEMTQSCLGDVMEILAKISIDDSCRKFTNKLLSCFSVDQIGSISENCFKKFTEKELLQSASCPAKEYYAALLEALISKFGKNHLKSFYRKLVASFYGASPYLTSDKKMLWMKILLAGARYGNFILEADQSRLVMQCMDIKNSKSRLVDKALLDAEMIILLNLLKERPNFIIPIVFSITLCRIFDYLFTLCSTKKLSKSEVAPKKSKENRKRKRKHQQDANLNDDISSGDEQKKDNLEENFKKLDMNSNEEIPECEQLEKSISTFRTILHLLKILPDEGKLIQSHIIGACIVKYRKRSLKLEFQRHFQEMMQFLVDSVKDTQHFKLVLNNASLFDALVLNQFQNK